MSLTVQQIYDAYSVRTFVRRIEVKRKLTTAGYETNFNDVTTLALIPNLVSAVKNINTTAANSNFNFGFTESSSVVLEFESILGQFSDETNANSIFFGFIRHESLIRVYDGFVDYSDISNPIPIYNLIFEGFIDDTSDSTKVDNDNINQSLLVVDTLSYLLQKYTLADVGAISNGTLINVIFDILNRTLFTNFFTVSLININPPVNATAVSVGSSSYEQQTQLYNVFQNLLLGTAYVTVKNGIFYCNPIRTANNTGLTITNGKIIQKQSFNNGVSAVFELIYWNNTNLSFVSITNKYNRSQTIDISGINNTASRNNILDYIGNYTRIQRYKFTLIIPYAPFLYLYDSIIVSFSSITNASTLIWDQSPWDLTVWGATQDASVIPNNISWVIKGINHSDYKTTLMLEQNI
jgi:hypothetical protein